MEQEKTQCQLHGTLGKWDAELLNLHCAHNTDARIHSFDHACMQSIIHVLFHSCKTGAKYSNSAVGPYHWIHLSGVALFFIVVKHVVHLPLHGQATHLVEKLIGSTIIQDSNGTHLLPAPKHLRSKRQCLIVLSEPFVSDDVCLGLVLRMWICGFVDLFTGLSVKKMCV